MPLPTIPSGNVASATASTGFNVANSCRWDFGSSPEMEKTLSNGDRQKWTISWWMKLGLPPSGRAYNIFKIWTSSTTKLNCTLADGGAFSINGEISDSVGFNLITNALYRDPSAWYNFIFAVDTTQGTAANRMKLYVNGSQVTSFATETYPAEDYNCGINVASDEFYWGVAQNSTNFFDGYFAEVVFIDGLQLTPTSFGEFDEDSPTIFKPIDVSGLTFGTNGFYLDFEDSSNLGNDANGGTDLTETNLAATDQTTDTPTNNFATWNPLWRWALDNDTAYSQGNTFAYFSTASDRGFAFSSMAVSAGKWYWEVKLPTVGRMYCGVGDPNVCAGINSGFWDAAGSSGESYSLIIRASNGKIQTEGSTETTYANAASDGDIIMWALDMDNNRLWYGINGTWQDSGDPTSGATGTGDVTTQISKQTHLTQSHFIAPCVGDPSTAGGSTSEVNFGNPAFAISSGNTDGTYGNFEYAVPSGFKALCTKNLGSDGG
jgi:hypothetical protein